MGQLCQVTPFDRSKAAALLQTIYDENPSHWPHGLTLGHFDQGDLYLIHKSAFASAPAGFVGWQKRKVAGVDVGFYAIGLVPEERGRGLAREAVSQLLAQKAASVDHVFALVVDTNQPSDKLAAALGIPVMRVGKQASVGSALRAAAKSPYTYTVPGLAYATAVVQDNQMHPEEPGFDFASPFRFTEHDKSRNIINVVNMALGGIGGGLAGGGINALKSRSKFTGMSAKAQAGRSEALATAGKLLGGAAGSTLVVPIGKDLQMHAHKAVQGVADLPKAIREVGEKFVRPAQAGTPENNDRMLWAAGIVSAALLTGGLGLAHALRRQNGSQQQMGRIKVTLPTRQPGDAETVVELPYNPETSLTTALRHRLDVDAKRRLYAETRSRIHRRNLSPEQKAQLTAVTA